jgi:hypothetical protein
MGFVFVFKVNVVIIRRGIFPFFLVQKYRQSSDTTNINASVTANGYGLGDKNVKKRNVQH